MVDPIVFLSDTIRAWAKRFYQWQNVMSNDTHAAAYSAVLQYLRAMQKAGTEAAEPVMAALRSMTVSDMFTPKGTIRADGKMIFDRYFVRVKSPAESNGPWDYLAITAKIDAADTFRPLSESECRLVRS